MYVNLYIACMNKYNFVKAYIALNPNVNNMLGTLDQSEENIHH